MLGLLRKLFLLAAILWIVSFPAAFFIGGIAFSHPDRQKVNVEVLRGAMRPEWDLSFLGAAREVRVALGDRTYMSASVFGGNSWATVIVLHGADETRVAALDAAYQLWKGGLDVVLVDRRAHGSSDGDLLPLFGGETADVKSLVDAVLREHWTGTQRIGLFGIADGGTTCLMAAAQDERIDAVAAANPAVRAADFIEDDLAGMFNLPQFIVTLQARVAALGVSMVSGVDSQKLDANAVLAGMKAPVYLLRTPGTPQGRRVAAVAKALPPRGTEIDNLDGEDDPDRYDGLVNFFRRTL